MSLSLLTLAVLVFCPSNGKSLYDSLQDQDSLRTPRGPSWFPSSGREVGLPTHRAGGCVEGETVPLRAGTELLSLHPRSTGLRPGTMCRGPNFSQLPNHLAQTQALCRGHWPACDSPFHCLLLCVSTAGTPLTRACCSPVLGTTGLSQH